jgi:hypothetical protein
MAKIRRASLEFHHLRAFAGWAVNAENISSLSPSHRYEAGAGFAPADCRSTGRGGVVVKPAFSRNEVVVGSAVTLAVLRASDRPRARSE